MMKSGSRVGESVPRPRDPGSDGSPQIEVEVSSVAQMTPLTGAEGPNLDSALQAIITWANSTSLRREIIRESGFPLPDDMPAFLLVNQLVFRGAARPTDLADAIQTGRSNVAKIVQRLETAGITVRLPDPRDDRAVVVGLTAHGRVIGESILKTHRRMTGQDESWSDEEQRTLETLLVKLARTIDALPGHPLSGATGLRLN